MNYATFDRDGKLVDLRPPGFDEAEVDAKCVFCYWITEQVLQIYPFACFTRAHRIVAVNVPEEQWKALTEKKKAGGEDITLFFHYVPQSQIIRIVKP